MTYFYRRTLIEKAGKGNPWKDEGAKFTSKDKDEDGKPYSFSGKEKEAMAGPKKALKAAVKDGSLKGGLNYTEPGVQDMIARAAGLSSFAGVSEAQANYLIDKYIKYTDGAEGKPAKAKKEPAAPKEQGPPKLVPKAKYKTNGEMTADIMAAAKKYPGHPLDVADFARKVMDKFPLSSKKILYDDQLAKLEPTMREALLKAAIASDKAKFEALQPGNQDGYLQTEKGTPGFGRYDAPKPAKAAPVKLFDAPQEALMDKAIGALELAEKGSDLTKASKALASLAKKIGDKHPMYAKVSSISGWLAGRGQIGWSDRVSDYANSALNGLLDEMAKLEKGKK